MIPLPLIEKGKSVKIQKISGGRGFSLRLMDMGIKEGDVVKIINNSQGSLLISLENIRLVLGRDAAFRIFVKYAKE